MYGFIVVAWASKRNGSGGLIAASPSTLLLLRHTVSSTERRIQEVKPVETHERVGILLPEETLRRVTAKRPTWEHAEKYAVAAERLGLEAVLLSLSGYDPNEKWVRGYILRKGRWRSWKGPLPKVIHNRLIPATLGVAHIVKLLQRERSVTLFNPVVPRDRWHVWDALRSRRSLHGRLPSTHPLDQALCSRLPDLVREWGSVVVRPGYGALGSSSLFIEESGRRRFRVRRPRGGSRVVGADRLVQMMGRRRLRWPCVVQEALTLLPYEGSPWELRVAVQRDGAGKWRLINGVALTSRGAQPHRRVLGELLARPEAIWNEVRRLALEAAESLGARFRSTADLGVDFGIDAQGSPWLLDVTFRDQRTAFLEAGELSTHSQLYENPMIYAQSLLRGA